MSDPQDPHLEFSRPIGVVSLPPEGRTVGVEASEAERAALAARFGLTELHRFAATVLVRPLGAGRGVTQVEVSADLEADVEQTCVVTLDRVPGRIAEAVRRRFSDDSATDDTAAVLDVHPGEDDDEADPIVDGTIDIGEVLAEALGLALDPHPRAPGAVFDSAAWSDEDDAGETAPGAFAALAALKTGSSGT
ncbi:DUF177 domain-containing protein [uncultured Rhodospira sp.]|uniref:YceD family protein n=1 Tax=uncultured Rhodospira sp. TaxID=1936189 RepID=UPI002619F77D|nr:DUF177 domain-containing protein [uncultured Rhodospira sp.]